MQEQWSQRADAAEGAVVARHVRRLWGLPGTALAVVAWPPVRRERLYFRWHYWWQAHLLDCAVDAADREPTAKRRRRLAKIARAHRVRNISGWTNNYYDDMAWLGLALERAQRMHAVDNRGGIQALEMELFDAWMPDSGGGIPWRKGDSFFNTPANGPASILLARSGRLWRAQAMADWIDATLRDPDTGLIFDGIRASGARGTTQMGGGDVDRAVYSYCQGVVLGIETELAVRLGAPRHRERVHALVAAVDTHLCRDGVVVGSGGGDGGLFDGILARYLALVATMLPGDTDEDDGARALAANIVLRSAEAAWENRLEVEDHPLFGASWETQARLPGPGHTVATFTGGTVRSSVVPERDLSVQLSGWMLMEAAYTVSSAGYR
ncbi:glycoside hydrolase family 76 protein [Rhodococcoides kyotonense]|uniref:Predicted alpha-1,6-mannanase, GH76 family n=1 Tax=Rhodococcoides kyotonense TaxID=398843 RepID=A0A239GIQ3_9NOCA|nr:glycoside hydrolase family 76 protein [Rhodococcus kyotonensis]SNS68658.1 Predicted alpha-1,6-mannanase, GH76 family [Rhodococcus kyotonensis]